jgi:hypothetical protein
MFALDAKPGIAQGFHDTADGPARRPVALASDAAGLAALG